MTSRKHGHELGNLQTLKKMGFIVGRKIGEGTYSRVCQADKIVNDGPVKIACKIINKNHADGEFIKRFLSREIKVVSTIKHPNIVRVTDIIQIKDVIYMFMDYCKNGDLLDYIRRWGALSQSRTKHYFRQIAHAVEYLHSRNLAHRDIKCENVLLASNNSVKLGDFGFARSCVGDDGRIDYSTTFCGSTAYAAPEILQGIPYDPKMYDIWTLGCILYIMLTACMPFNDSNIKKMLEAQLEHSTRCQYYSKWKQESPDIVAILGKLLEPDVSKRAVIQQVVECQWLK